MPDYNPIKQLQRRLVELGCPTKFVRKIVRETAEHYEDLLRSAQAQGLSPAQIAPSAAELLGDPRQLAQQHFEVVRNSSWWGRHPFLGFGLLPLISAPFCLAFFVAASWLAVFAYFKAMVPQQMDQPDYLVWNYGVGCGVMNVGLVLMVLFYCWRARRAGVRFQWILITCLLISFYTWSCQATFFASGPDDSNFSLDFFDDASPGEANQMNAIIPLLVAGLAYLLQRRTAKHLAMASLY